MVLSLSSGAARRIALSAQGFGQESIKPPSVNELSTVIDTLQLLQIDSVNVFERSHYLPAFSRLGSYSKAELDEITYGTRMTEYWAHEASFIPLKTRPLLQWRMDDYRNRDKNTSDSWANAHPKMLTWLRAELAEKGPLAAREIEHDANKRSGPWWGWSEVKTGLEVLFRWGEVVSAGRRRFERVYALAEHVLPDSIHNSTVARAEAIHELVRISARAHGVGTAHDFADYFRLKNADVSDAIKELEDSGELIEAVVEGWSQKAWLHREAHDSPLRETTTLLSPFDPVIWKRDRAERLFNFRYRIEIYTPAEKRIYGYYVLPILMNDRLVGRVDLKNDRQAGILRVQAAWNEPDAPSELAAHLALLLEEAANWQGLNQVVVASRGNLVEALSREIQRV